MKEFHERKRVRSSAYFPAFLKLRGKRCIVVGGGEVALRRIKTILSCGGEVIVISPDLHPELRLFFEKGMIQWLDRNYETEDLQGAFIVIAATDREEVNQQIAQQGRNLRSLVNVVDDPEESDFIVPSFFQRDNLIVAVSTSGKSPALARKIRETLEMNFDEEYGELVSLVEEVRLEFKRMKKSIRPETWQKALDLNPLMEFLKKGEREKAKATLIEQLNTFS
jgi:precorrin-2 dehydrogenase/sirohydrochlorin ferrochelatase